MHADDYIRQLNMTRHKEGGWFKECILSEEKDADGRELFSSIYFLLEKDDASRFHRLKSEEVWYWQAGGTMNIYTIGSDGRLGLTKLGPDVKKGEKLQVKIPAGTAFGAFVSAGDFALVGCMCAPAFRYEDFELLDGYDLKRKYPGYAYVIGRLTE